MEPDKEFFKQLREIHGLAGTIPSDEVKNSDDSRNRERVAMIMAYLGDRVEEAQVQKVLALQQELDKKQSDSQRRLQSKEIDVAQHEKEQYKECLEIFLQIEKTLGSEEFEILFDMAPSDAAAFVSGLGLANPGY